MYGKALFIVVVLIVIYAFSCAFGLDVSKMSIDNNPIKAYVARSTRSKDERVSDPNEMDGPFSLTSNRHIDDVDQIESTEGFAGQLNAIGNVSVYDPISMGAIKQTEVDAHHKGLMERGSFSTTGAIQPSRVKRDDDPYTRETGVPWIGGLPNRAFNRKIGGPQSGARESVSASTKSIEELHRTANKSSVWIG
jgi:hypothetical protein